MASIQGIYVALFGRPADPAGLAYFNEATNNGANLDAIGDLAKTDEYQSRFANMTNEEIVNSIYKSLFERDGEKAGIDFYVGELAAGRLNINNIAIAILDGAKNDDLATVNAKIAAADIFTSHLDLNAEIEAYRGSTAAGIGREFLDTVTKDDPGTAEEADAAILKLFPDQGQLPGGGGGGGGASPTFIIHHESEAGITFGGSATGEITLGQEPNGDVPEIGLLKSIFLGTVLTGERGSIDATFVPNTPVDATFGVKIAELPADLKLVDGLAVSLNAATASGHDISGDGNAWVSGSEGDQDIHVTATGGNHIEGGLGADTIDIDGATGMDTIEIHGVDSSLIEAVYGAEDAIETHNGEHEQLVQEQTSAHEALSEAQTVKADEAVFQEQTDAQSAFDAIGGEEGLADLDKAAADAASLLEERNTLQATADEKHDEQTQAYQDEAAADNAYDKAFDHNASVSAYNSATLVTNTVVFVPKTGDTFAGRVASNTNIDVIKGLINTQNIDQALKDQLIAALPAKVDIFGNAPAPFNDTAERDAYKTAATTIINNYKTSVANDLTAKLDALTEAKENADIAHDAYVGAKNALDQHQSAHPGDLGQALTDANAAAQVGHDKQDALTHANEAADARHTLIDAADHADTAVADSEAHGLELQTALDDAKADVAGTAHDSMLGHEDHVVGFELGKDVLNLPSINVIHDVNLTYNVEGQGTYHISVTNGIASIVDGDETPVFVNSALMETVYHELSKDDVIGNGQTVAFLYDEDNNGTADGLYVFQGGDFGSDIGVKLVGLTNAESLYQVLSHPA